MLAWSQLSYPSLTISCHYQIKAKMLKTIFKKKRNCTKQKCVLHFHALVCLHVHLWCLISLKSCAHKNQACTRDSSAQDSIHKQKSILREGAFLAAACVFLH